MPLHQCGYHGLALNGQWPLRSRAGQAPLSDSVRVRSYPLVEKNQFVWICMGYTAAAELTKDRPFPLS